MKVPGRLVIRADGGPTMGTGHLMRSLALGEAWRVAGGDVSFVTRCESDQLVQRLRQTGKVHSLPADPMSTTAWSLTSKALAANPHAWVAVDGYHFDSAYLKRIQAAGHPLLLLDDTAALEVYDAEIIVNQNLHAFDLDYRVGACSQLLLGPAYALLRSEFRAARPRASTPDEARRILVSMGGADPSAMTERAIDALALAGGRLECRIVVGGANPRSKAIKAKAARSSVEMIAVANVTEMPDLMRWADLAISSGGTTVWELAYMGVPALLVETSPAERLLLVGLRGANLYERIGDVQTATVERIAEAVASRVGDVNWRRAMMDTGRRTVDGRGVDRVLSAMLRVGRLGVRA